jgi:hypothetical protein
MVVTRGRGREARKDSSHHKGVRAMEWKAVVAAHHAGDWPPPEWRAAVGEGSSAGVSGG